MLLFLQIITYFSLVNHRTSDSTNIMLRHNVHRLQCYCSNGMSQQLDLEVTIIGNIARQ